MTNQREHRLSGRLRRIDRERKKLHQRRTEEREEKPVKGLKRLRQDAKDEAGFTLREFGVIGSDIGADFVREGLQMGFDVAVGALTLGLIPTPAVASQPRRRRTVRRRY